MTTKHPLDMVDEPMRLFPPITDKLLAALEALFPRRIPLPGRTSAEQIWFQAGQQRLVQYLREVKEWQESPEDGAAD